MAICLERGCPVIVARGRCRTHAAQHEGARPNVDLRRWYRTALWARLRSLVLQEEPLCPECAADGMVTATSDVHHTERATRENFFDRAILQALCHAHHSRHTQRGE